ARRGPQATRLESGQLLGRLDGDIDRRQARDHRHQSRPDRRCGPRAGDPRRSRLSARSVPVPLADRIQDLSNRSLTDLAAARHYFEHTKAVWRLTRQLTNLGHSFEIPISQTGTIITLPELAAQAQGYVALYLAESVFQQFVALFE